MKKTLLSVLALFTFALCNAQVKTQSNYDVDGNGKVTIEDVTSTVNKVIGKATDERTLVDGESLNATLLEILSKLKSLDERIANLEKKNCTCNCSGETTDPYNGHEYVDLGLPSGLKWATCNLGAENPEDYGYYYAWGATEPQDVYNWVYTPFQTQNTTDGSSIKFTKYLGSTSSSYKDPSATDANAFKTVLDPEDDAAHVNWGGDWRMPTTEEQDELRENCYWKWVTSYNGKSVNGYIVYKVKDSADKGKMTNNNSSYSPVGSYSVSDPHLFLPAAGCRYDSSLDLAGWVGYYWSSSLSSSNPDYACELIFGSGYVDWDYDVRQYGRSVRPVCQ